MTTEMSKVKVYIAGPIRGVADYKERFAKERKALEGNGFAVLDPSILPEGMSQEDYMRISMAMMQSADGMILLEGWENSEGARIEKAYADMVGIPVYLLEKGKLYE